MLVSKCFERAQVKRHRFCQGAKTFLYRAVLYQRVRLVGQVHHVVGAACIGISYDGIEMGKPPEDVDVITEFRRRRQDLPQCLDFLVGLEERLAGIRIQEACIDDPFKAFVSGVISLITEILRFCPFDLVQKVPEKRIEILNHAADVGRIKPQRLSQFTQHAHKVDDQTNTLASTARVHAGTIHARDGLQQHVIPHRFVEIHAVENRCVVARQQFVRHDENFRVFPCLFEHKARVRLTFRRELEFRNKRAVNNVVHVLRIDRHGPFGRQEFIKRVLVLGAGFPIDAHEERFVSKRLDVFLEVFSDERGNVLDTIIGGQKRTQPDCTIKHVVQFVNVSDAFYLGQGEKFLVESIRGYGHVTRRHRMTNRQRRLVLNRLGDGVLVKIPQLIVGTEYLEGALPVRGTVNRRTGESDDRRVRHGRHQIRTQVLGHRAVRLVNEDIHVVTGVHVFFETFKLVDHGQNQAAFVGFEQIPKLGLGVRAPHRNILLLHLTEQPLDPAFDLPFKFRSIHDHHDRRLTEPVFAFHDQARGNKERKRLTGTLRMPDEPTPFRRLRATIDDAVHRPALMLA